MEVCWLLFQNAVVQKFLEYCHRILLIAVWECWCWSFRILPWKCVDCCLGMLVLKFQNTAMEVRWLFQATSWRQRDCWTVFRRMAHWLQGVVMPLLPYQTLNWVSPDCTGRHSPLLFHLIFYPDVFEDGADSDLDVHWIRRKLFAVQNVCFHFNVRFQ